MPPIGTLVLGYGDLGTPPRRRARGTEHWGERYYWVNTHDEDAALAAAGVPQHGAAWGPSAPSGLVVTDRETRYVGGKDNPVTGVNGITVVRCLYETPGYSGRRPIPNLTLSFTELTFEEVTTTQHYHLDGDPVPLNNGDGVPRESTRVTADCIYYRTPATLNLTSIFNVVDHINSDSFRLPPLIPGDTNRMLVSPGFARMRAPMIRALSTMVEITYRLVLSPDHKAYAQLENSQGEAVLTQIIEQYETASFSSHFP